MISIFMSICLNDVTKYLLLRGHLFHGLKKFFIRTTYSHSSIDYLEHKQHIDVVTTDIESLELRFLGNTRDW